MLPTHDVPCPRYGKAPFSALSLDDGINAATPESPKVEHAPGGYFIHCPFCRERVAVEPISAGSATGFQVARPL